jgi:hypothetical protein
VEDGVTGKETGWRAELINGSDEVWCVIGEDGWEIASELNEPTARLIAAANEMQAALEWAERALAPFSTEPAEQSGMAKIRAALAKARPR